MGRTCGCLAPRLVLSLDNTQVAAGHQIRQPPNPSPSHLKAANLWCSWQP